MHLKWLAVAFVAAVLVAAPAPAAAACCDQHAKTQGACCDMPCCQEHQKKSAEPSLEPVRQTAEVWFKRPLLIGQRLLLGRYVIEHDNDRMARGEPCTHIYAYDDRSKPVAAFHCTHLERDRADQNTVVVYTGPDGRIQRLAEFQFAGESAAHGYPTVR